MAFCVFEAAVGLFWPSMMKMRSQHVPEDTRSTIINFFRIPLNLFVCVVLYNVRPIPSAALRSAHPCVCIMLYFMRLIPLRCLIQLPSLHSAELCVCDMRSQDLCRKPVRFR